MIYLRPSALSAGFLSLCARDFGEESIIPLIDPAEYVHQFLREFFSKAQVAGDAIGIDVVIVDTGGHNGHAAEFSGQSLGNPAGDRFFLVRRDRQHRARSGAGGDGQRKNDDSDVWSFSPTHGHDQVIAEDLDPRLEPAAALRIFDPKYSAFHKHPQATL